MNECIGPNIGDLSITFFSAIFMLVSRSFGWFSEVSFGRDLDTYIMEVCCQSLSINQNEEWDVVHQMKPPQLLQTVIIIIIIIMGLPLKLLHLWGIFFSRRIWLCSEGVTASVHNTHSLFVRTVSYFYPLFLFFFYLLQFPSTFYFYFWVLWFSVEFLELLSDFRG